MHVTILLLLMLLVMGSLSSLAAEKEQPVMKTTVHRDGDRVWLEGVTGWSVGDQESSVHAAQAAIMQALGYSTSYDYLLGVSGLAFRMQVHKDGFCGSSPHPSCGYMCLDHSMRALPWQAKSYGVKPDDAEKVKEARQAVMASIDRGVPVQYGSEEDGVIIGYQKNGDEWICLHPYRDGGKKSFVEKTWPWGITIYTGPKDTLPALRDLQVASLRQAVTMAATKEADGYHLGYAAWEAYIAQLKTLETADEKTRAGEMQGNAWIYECLAQSRGAAARYLREIAAQYPPAAADHLRRAAEIYNDMADKVLSDREHAVIAVAPYPWGLKPGEQWLPAQIRQQVERLEKALPLEKAAIGEIEQALAVIEQQPYR
ncbi:MAG: hypothetical protein ACYC6A_19970 [Armatimonadota bacterium]